MTIRRIAVLALLAVTFVYGCIRITIPTTSNFHSEVEIAAGNLSGVCAGTSTTTGATSQATVRRVAQSDDTCRIEVTFEAVLIDSGEVRQQVEDKIREQGRDPDSVDVRITTPCKLTFSNMAVHGLTVPASPWNADLQLLGDDLVSLSGDSLADLETQQVQVSLGDAHIAALNQVYAREADVLIQGVLVFESIPNDVLANLPTDARTVLSFDALAELHANATLDLF